MRESALSAAIALLVAVLASGCAGIGPAAPVQEGAVGVPETYVVMRGDTLSAIAFRYELDWRDLAAWNRLDNPNLIYAGQRLRLRAPGSVPRHSSAPRSSASGPVAPSPPPRKSASPVPVQRIVRRDESPAPARRNDQKLGAERIKWHWPTEGKVVRGFQPDVPGRKGIQIAGRLGQTIHPASRGRVVYSGSGLPGYGRLIIVKHSDTFLSAYGYLGKILVKEGDTVTFDQSIAEMGTSNENRPVLHFEIRRNGKPVNPLEFLPG